MKAPEAETVAVAVAVSRFWKRPRKPSTSNGSTSPSSPPPTPPTSPATAEHDPTPTAAAPASTPTSTQAPKPPTPSPNAPHPYAASATPHPPTTGTGTKHLVDITITTPTGPATLTATNHHPFWNPDTHHWENADQLTTGDHLQTPTGQPTTITTTHTYQRVDTVYNLTIADLHTYYVLAGNTPILVHNSNCNIIASGIDNSAALSSHGVGDVFSGVYDPVDGRLVLRLSVDDDVTPPGSGFSYEIRRARSDSIGRLRRVPIGDRIYGPL
ncbi:polymorphic toxin-type HINT domain-containing protein [Frankia sp. CcI49]|uniref:polymorphic toxin-type HINT domain-containing protein n=1 Tax=Frankia sp. CcI49 TaxID=1745382 RepID=UPI000975DD8C|nr:polymorphic toxin-type HINT domain-containing protein [Frankia sp. CcI49]